MIGLFDVLEHLDDDRGVLRWLSSVLEPGGVLVLTVPAHPFLFDEMDEMAHHRRRYRREELREKLEAAGFEVEVVAHFMGVLLPLLVLVRLLGRLLPARPRARRDLELRVVPVVNSVLRLLLRIERWAGAKAPLPFGTPQPATAAAPPAAPAAAAPRRCPPGTAPPRRARKRTRSPPPPATSPRGAGGPVSACSWPETIPPRPCTCAARRAPRK